MKKENFKTADHLNRSTGRWIFRDMDQEEISMAFNDLKKLIGKSAYRSLTQNGGVLKIWRNSSPHNWWVEGKRGKMHWHSSSERPRYVPNIGLFRPLRHSEEKVIQYWGADSGSSCLSIYVLKKR